MPGVCVGQSVCGVPSRGSTTAWKGGRQSRLAGRGAAWKWHHLLARAHHARFQQSAGDGGRQPSALWSQEWKRPGSRLEEWGALFTSQASHRRGEPCWTFLNNPAIFKFHDMKNNRVWNGRAWLPPDRSTQIVCSLVLSSRPRLRITLSHHALDLLLCCLCLVSVAPDSQSQCTGVVALCTTTRWPIPVVHLRSQPGGRWDVLPDITGAAAMHSAAQRPPFASGQPAPLSVERRSGLHCLLRRRSCGW